MTSKKHLMLNIDKKIADEAVADPNIKVSEIIEKFLRVITATSKKEDSRKIYEAYQ